MKLILYRQAIVFVVFSAFLLVGTIGMSTAQETSADFSGGSMLMGNDTRACSGALEGAMRYSASSADITTGLIAHWEMNETSGTTATDSAGINDGTMTGGLDASTDSVAGQVSTALNMNGTSDYIEVNQDWDNTLSTFTYAVWIKPDNVTDQNLFFALNGNSLYPRASFTAAAGDIKFQLKIGGTTSSATFNTNLVTGVWQHVVFTFDNAAGNIYNLYIDGVLFDTNNFPDGTIDGGTSNLLIGRDTNNNLYFDGIMDDVRVYNRALTITEINALPGHTTDITSNLQGHWKFDETSGTNANDETASGYDGTLYGNPTWQGTGGKDGGALDFDGTDDEVYLDVVTPNTNLEIDGDLTVAAWVKTSISNANGAVLFLQDTGSVNNNYNLGLTSGAPYLDHGNGSTGEKFTATGTINDDTWHHVAAVTDYPNLYIYIDGVPDSGSPHTMTLDIVNVNSAAFKMSTNGSTWAYEGLLDDMRVYNRALTAGDINALPGVSIGNIQFCDGTTWGP